MINFTTCANVANSFLKVLQGYTKGIRFIALLTLLLGVGNAWAEEYTIGWGSASGTNSQNFTAVSGEVSGVLSFTSAKNSSSSNPAYNSNNKELRLYYNAQGNGGSITLTPASGVTITGAVITTSTNPSVKYTVDGGTATSVSETNKVYTISGISATNSLKIQNVNTSNTQLRIKTIKVTYEVSSSSTILTNAQFAWSAATAEATLPSTFDNQPTLTNTLGLGVSYSSSTPATATIDASGLVTLKAAGTTTISATFAGGKVGGTTYAAKTVSYTLTVKPAPLVIEPIDGGIIDILTHDCLAATSSSYTDFSGKQAKNDNHSDAVYAGRSSRNGNSTQYSVQLNTIDKGRIATTTTGGLAKRVYVRWATQATLNTNNRSLYIYGSNDAFTGSETSTSATQIGTVTFTTGAEEAYADLTGDYKHILITGSGAIYMDEIQITWIADQSALTAPTFTPAAGTYNAAQNVTISAEAGTNIHYTLDGTEPTTSSAKYTAPIQVSETKTIKAIAVKNEKVSQVASATYTINLPLTTMDQIFAKATAVGSTATAVEITFNNWVVTGVATNNKNVYVTDGTKGFIIFNNDGNHGFEVGNMLSGTASCKVQLFKGSAELTELTSSTTGLTITTGGTVTPVVVDDVTTLSGVNTGSIVKINGICQSENSKYYINGVQLYNSLFTYENPTIGATYDITGVYLQYDATKEILPRSAADIEVTQALPTATISIADISLEIEEQTTIEATITPDAAKNTVTYTIKSGDEYITLNGTTITAKAVGTATITATIPESIGNYYGATKDFTVTVTPKNIATLPFAFDGKQADIANTPGMSHEGIDASDYGSSPYLKINTTGDYLIIHFNGEPGTLQYDIKGNSYSGGTFTVQESTDGSAYTDLVNYTELTGSTSTKTHTLSSTSRYVKFIYTTKSSGNVALGNINIYGPASQLDAPTNLDATDVTHNSATLSWDAVANASSYAVNILDGENTLEEITTDQTSITIDNLNPGTDYLWGVTAIGDGTNYTNSEESETGEFTTQAAPLNTYTITYVTNGGRTIDPMTDATVLPNPLPTTTRDHYTFAGWFTDQDCTQAATAGATINADITLYAKWTPITYTVTFDAGSGTCATEPTQGNFEAGITLPTATPCTYAQENGWRFVGWSETTVSETTVRPAIHTGNYRPTKDIKLHAVYAKTGTAEGAAGEFILSLEYEGTTYYVGQTFDNNKLSAETEQTNAARFTIEDNYLHYEGGYISHVATTSSPNITKQADKANAKAWTITEEAYTVIFTSTADNTRGLGFNYNSGSPRFAAYQLSNDDYPHTFTKTSVSGGNVQVTTYNSKPSCEAPVAPTWGDVQITHTAIKANCGSTTVLGSEGENGPATISFSGTDLQNSVTVTASDGFLVSTYKTDPEKYAQSVIISPNSTGSNIGKITQNVHVIADATAKNESYTGTITLTGNDIPGYSQVINVTAAVTCTQYTITWSVNGDDSHQVTYSPGDALQLPSIPVTPCDGMDHVGWTDNMGYVHGKDILFTETTDMTVTSDKTYYAVFATLTSSGGGETTTTLNFSQQGYANQEKVTSLEIGRVTVSFSQGEASDPPAYYNTGTAIRVYAKGSFTVSSTNTISQIEITFGTGDGTNEISTNVGDYSDGTWKGSANEIIFTVGGDSKHRRIKSIAVTSAGGGASYYTDYTTTCEGRQLETPTNLQATDITYNGATLEWDAVAGANKYKVVINGTEYISNTNSYTTHDLKQQTAYTWTVQAIGNGTTFTDSEISAEATFTTGAELIITWSVSTATSTTTITKGQPIGANLKTPATPAACEGKYFMGWSASSTVNSDGSDFTPITSDIVPETNVTYYAVFATKEVGDGVALTQCNGSTTFEAGDNIVIVASGDGWSYLCYQKTSGTTYIVNHEFVNNATTLINDDKNYWTLETANGGFYLGDNTNGYMYIPTSNNLCVSTENKSTWTIEWNPETSAFNIKSDRWLSCRSDLETDNQYKWRGGGTDGASGTTNLQIYKISGSTSYTDYSTSCGTFTVTFYGFNSGGYTTICNDNRAEIAVAQGEPYQIPNCEPTFDPQGLGRTFAGTWNTQANGKGTAYEPGDEFIVNSDITLYAQWALNTSENITLPTDVEDLATTDVVVTGGTTLTLQAGTTTINSLTLKGGIQADGSYKMPIINIPDNATLKRKSDIIYLDLVVNAKNYYPFAVPFRAKNGSDKANWDYVGYIDPDLKEAATYRTHFVIKTYDGAKRAENGENRDANWVIVNRDTYLEPGIGYMITAMTAGKNTVTMRIPMRVSDDWFAGGEQTTLNEVTRNQVAVTAYTGKASDPNNGGHQRHAGWNFVANPYLANFAGTNASGSFINGEILINKGDYSYGGDDVPYVTIPTYNFEHYYQVKLSEATLSPAYSFFVQVGTDGTMTFGRQAAPASIAARNAEERPVKMDVDITLSDNHSSDQTGIIISDRYSDAYEIGRDLEKLFGSAYNLSVYTLMADNTPLAFQALAIRSNMQVIPVGYRTPAQGEYTFRLNEATSSIDLLNEQYEQLVLVDYQTGELTNLLISDYTFYSERTQADNRFAIYAVPRQNAPTDLPNAIGQDKEAQKIIHNGHLYILRDGNVYNGNGQIVK